MIIYPETKNPLTPKEEAMREEMIYYFNPVLKHIFYSRNPYEFARFGFNSCRQTAIFGAAYLRKHFPDYTYKAYEGNFEDVVEGNKVDYTHAFIIATADYLVTKSTVSRNDTLEDRSLLIDISRTMRPLKFQVITNWQNIYDRNNDYRHCRLKNMRVLSVDPTIQTDDLEYLTQLPSALVCQLVEKLTEELHRLTPDDVKNFYTSVYGKLTTLLKETR